MTTAVIDDALKTASMFSFVKDILNMVRLAIPIIVPAKQIAIPSSMLIILLLNAIVFFK